MNRLDNEENVKLKSDTQTYHHRRDNRKKTILTVSSLIVLFNLQHALSSVREGKRFLLLLLLLFDESGMFCRLICVRQQIHLYASKTAQEAKKISLLKYEVAIDWFRGSLEEELVDLFAEYASGKKDIRLFCGIEVIFIDRNRFCLRHS